jgi:hypothetical protein
MKTRAGNFSAGQGCSAEEAADIANIHAMNLAITALEGGQTFDIPLSELLAMREALRESLSTFDDIKRFHA